MTGPVEALRLGIQALVRRAARATDIADVPDGIGFEVVSTTTGNRQRHGATQSALDSRGMAR
jgi:hypothetical protein